MDLLDQLVISMVFLYGRGGGLGDLYDGGDFNGDVDSAPDSPHQPTTQSVEDVAKN
jgi:hypothetical protein